VQPRLCGLQMFVKADQGKRFLNSRTKLRFRAAAWPRRECSIARTQLPLLYASTASIPGVVGSQPQQVQLQKDSGPFVRGNPGIRPSNRR